MKALVGVGLAVSAAVLGCGLAFAQQGTTSRNLNGAGGTKSSAIEVDADQVETLRDEGKAVYTKNVSVVQDNTRLKTDKLTVISHCVKSAAGATDCSGIESYVADGNVYFVTPNTRVRADHAVYDYDNKVITMTGEVILAQGDQSIMRGRKLIYQADIGKATMTGEDGGGILSFFTPEQRDKPTSKAPTDSGSAPH